METEYKNIAFHADMELWYSLHQIAKSKGMKFRPFLILICKNEVERNEIKQADKLKSPEPEPETYTEVDGKSLEPPEDPKSNF